MLLCCGVQEILGKAHIWLCSEKLTYEGKLVCNFLAHETCSTKTRWQPFSALFIGVTRCFLTVLSAHIHVHRKMIPAMSSFRGNNRRARLLPLLEASEKHKHWSKEHVHTCPMLNPQKSNSDASVTSVEAYEVSLIILHGNILK